MLLKPWHDLQRDLKTANMSWSQAFEEFLETASNETLAILSGIGYLHDCQTAMTNDNIDHGVQNFERDSEDIEDRDNDDEDYEMENGESGAKETEESLNAIIRAQTSLGEEIHGRLAIEHAKRAKIFENEGEGNMWVASDHTTVVENASGDDLQKLGQWRMQLEQDVARINDTDVRVDGCRQTGHMHVENVTESVVERGLQSIRLS